MGRKSSLQISDGIENGSLVWVLYRKKAWPVKVKRVYPKKITYNFLPVQNHPNVFSAELKNVKIFKETDKVPPDGSEEQREAYEIAMRIVKNEYDEEKPTNSTDDDQQDLTKNENEEINNDSGSYEDEPVMKKKNLISSTSVDQTDKNKKPNTNLKPNASKNEQLKESKGNIESTSQNKIPVMSKANDKEKINSISESYDDNGDANNQKNTAAKNFKVKRKNKLKEIKNGSSENANNSDEDNDSVKEVEAKKFNLEQYFKGNLKRSFNPGDAVIINTNVGMWPGIVTKTSNAKEVAYRIFPLETSPEEANIDIDYLVPFPEKHLETLIAENKNSPLLHKALCCVKVYMSVKRSKSENNSNDMVTKRNDGMSKRNNKTVALVATTLSNKKWNDAIDTERRSRKRPTSKEDKPEEIVDNGESKKHKQPSVNAKNSKRLKPESLSSENNEENVNNEMYENGDKAIESSVKNLRSKRKKRNNVSEQESSRNARNGIEYEMEEKLSTVSTSKFKQPFISILLSEDTKDHLNGIWTKRQKSRRNTIYVPPKTIKELKFNFLCGDLLTIEELDKALNEMHSWIALCTRIPPMSPIFEQHYIANVVLPEACVFALSQMHGCTVEEAELTYQNLLTEPDTVQAKPKEGRNGSSTKLEPSSKNVASSSNNDGSNNHSSNGTLNMIQSQKSSTAFQGLLLAATIMQDKEKNGVTISKNTSNNNNM